MKWKLYCSGSSFSDKASQQWFCFEIWIIITIVNQSTGEDHKIGEKKQLALIKDLKRQLLAEKSQNEKLSEKMAEIVIQESVTNEHAIQNETNQNLPLANSG